MKAHDDSRERPAHFKPQKINYMSFDFQKAINGDPVWYEGTPAVISEYDVLNKEFKVMLPRVGLITCNNKGKIMDLDGNLSTDPPMKKIKKTVWLGIVQIGEKDAYGTTSAYEKKEQVKACVTLYNLIGIYSVEIEVEEPQS